MFKKYKKKPVVINAIQNTPENYDEIIKLATKKEWGMQNDINGGVSVSIHTLEGIMKANPNDYIIEGVSGEFYPCKPDIFDKTYEEVEE